MFRPLYRFATSLGSPLISSAAALPPGLAGLILPQLPNTGDYTRLVLSIGGAYYEAVKVTRNGNALILGRGEEGSAAQSWASSASITYENTPQTIIDTQQLACGSCDDIPVAPLPDGVYSNPTLQIANGALAGISAGQRVIVQEYDGCGARWAVVAPRGQPGRLV